MKVRPIAAVLALGLLAGARLAQGGATSPQLAIAAAVGLLGEGRRAVAIEAGYDFPNAVQVGYPLQIVVFQGTRFVRYPIGGSPVTGESALLADGGLDAADLGAFLAQGTAAPADVRILTLTGSEARVALPAEFAAGTATAVLFTVLADGATLSNPLALVLP
jgi:hypothetical protein